MKIVPFEPVHLTRILLQPSQAIMQPTMSNPEYGPSLALAGPAYSLVDGDEVFATAGLIKQWDHRAIAWALISGEAGKHFFALHKAVRRALNLHYYRRVETAVACDFPQGHRWAELLGFEREGRMRAYTPDGHDCDLYARIS
jgi:hypothetical protein